MPTMIGDMQDISEPNQTPFHTVGLAKTVIKVVAGMLIVFGAFRGTTMYLARQKLAHEAQIKSACPTLFSVARTPRDTLLVMRSESMCVGYLLNTLQ